jgi:hypothetical protein
MVVNVLFSGPTVISWKKSDSSGLNYNFLATGNHLHSNDQRISLTEVNDQGSTLNIQVRNLPYFQASTLNIQVRNLPYFQATNLTIQVRNLSYFQASTLTIHVNNLSNLFPLFTYFNFVNQESNKCTVRFLHLPSSK